jgi:hypothetical protein
VGDSQSPTALLPLLNALTVLSLSHVRGSRPVFRIPPNKESLAPIPLVGSRIPTRWGVNRRFEI